MCRIKILVDIRSMGHVVVNLWSKKAHFEKETYLYRRKILYIFDFIVRKQRDDKKI